MSDYFFDKDCPSYKQGNGTAEYWKSECEKQDAIWKHQQKKIDELEKLIEKARDIAKSNSHGEFVGGVFVSHKQACIIYSQWLKEKLSKLDEKGEGE